ncbi:hypothetical protein phiCT453A_54 (endogenous virus) [Clostridium phage phiCT453A]|uniref:hypothetical protein n=1 Tax=Clostridium phage phiCT453A TaxID=1567012 RepID=UPI000513D888|nr:hypothetical protein [Clostridium tetani]YP_009216698.1 hypothetical protein phiCT453A_54 [Clostridium phage phiCT453A]AJA42544.1 hypothetical protein phiCT453A_54 [Clostridium phage phiCT453A]KGI42522.1 hypothetical protein KY55_10615 [Clostridium tetani]RXM58856.1 hypothetical protein DP133_02300 [Clostridium tetani]
MTKEVYIIYYFNYGSDPETGENIVVPASTIEETKEEMENALRIIKLNYEKLGEIKVVKGTRPLTEQELKEVAFQNMGRELANLKLENMEKEQTLGKIGEELSKEKLQRMLSDSTNLRLLEEVELLSQKVQNMMKKDVL